MLGHLSLKIVPDSTYLELNLFLGFSENQSSEVAFPSKFYLHKENPAHVSLRIDFLSQYHGIIDAFSIDGVSLFNKGQQNVTMSQ
ncbi:hypothetical protein QQX98_010224 [Neonectria punicea]|uniref:Uncharacterized protein n=1 Tax=Neonectria punicea TaxID=979145 RepID=A0ABR1GQE7_9HYPO